MRKIILILFFFLSSLSLFSQQDSVLKNFKFRNVNYRAITFLIGGSGQYENSQYQLGDSRSHSANGNFSVDYYTIKSTDKILLSASGSASLAVNSNKITSPTEKSKGSSYYSAPAF